MTGKLKPSYVFKEEKDALNNFSNLLIVRIRGN